MIQNINSNNPSPAEQGHHVYPLDYGLLGDLNYIFDRTAPTTDNLATALVDTVIIEAVANLGLAHVSPIASP